MKTYLVSVGVVVMCAMGAAVMAADNSASVDLFIGTGGDNGQVDPAACVPYGMVRICPDSDPRSHVGYDYRVARISGFSVNRISGIGCGGAGGNLSIKPSAKDAVLSLVKSEEFARPGYYVTELDNGVRAEFTATNNVAIERYQYPQGEQAVMTLNIGTSFGRLRGAEYEVVSDRELAGYVWAGNTCDHGAYRLFFNLTADKPFKKISATDNLFEFEFDNSDTRPIEIRIALSPIDEQTARLENEQFAESDFDELRSEAAQLWREKLDAIELRGGTDEYRTLFYTSLYRVFLSPADVTSIDGEFLGTDGKVRNADGFRYYSSWSMWDSYRTKFPLILLLDTPRMRDMAVSLTKLFMYGKRNWATDFESTPTVRTEHSIVVLLDAYQKGIVDIDLRSAYSGIKTEMESLLTERPDQALETAIDFWAMAKIARIVGESADAEMYGKMADSVFGSSWERDFKSVDDSFLNMRNSGLYQGNKWQYRWALPQYVGVMSKSIGGDKMLGEQLEYFFEHNINNQTNEPGIHAPYIFNRLGQPAKAQRIVMDMLTQETTHLYGGNAEYSKPVVSKIFKVSPEGYLPEMDEDDGTMSAWYVFSSIGLYPLVVGEPWYEIISPLFDAVQIRLTNGRTLKIETRGRKSLNDPIKSISFNGKAIADYRIDHQSIVKGGTLLLKY